MQIIKEALAGSILGTLLALLLTASGLPRGTIAEPTVAVIEKIVALLPELQILGLGALAGALIGWLIGWFQVTILEYFAHPTDPAISSVLLGIIGTAYIGSVSAMSSAGSSTSSQTIAGITAGIFSALLGGFGGFVVGAIVVGLVEYITKD